MVEAVDEQALDVGPALVRRWATEGLHAVAASGRVGTPLTIPVVVLVRHDHEVAVAQRLDVLGRVLRAEAEAQDLDDVLDLRCGARRWRADGVGRLSRPR